MSVKKLRSKLDLSNLKFFLPLRNTSRPPVGITPDFSDKMFRRTTKSSARQVEGQAPPPPPKDNGGRHYSFYGPRADWEDLRYAVMASPISEDAPSPPGLIDSTTQVLVISHQMRSPPPPRYSRLPPLPDETGVMLPPDSLAVPPKSKLVHTRTMTSRIPLAAGRTPPPMPRRRVATISSPEEAEIRRRDAQRRKELQEAELLREEAQRQARLKYEKEQLLLQVAREDAARKAALQAELRRAADERRKREAIEHEADELSKMVSEERKRQDRERRRAEARKLQDERARLERERREQAEERRAWRDRKAGERRVLAARLESRKNARALSVLLTGWLTVQSEDCLSYKRRYFQLREDALLLFKDAEDDSKPLETVHLSRIQTLREAEDGYEDLQAIKNSFALELRDVHDPWTMFADSNENKENLLALLSSRLSTRLRRSIYA